MAVGKHGAQPSIFRDPTISLSWAHTQRLLQEPQEPQEPWGSPLKTKLSSGSQTCEAFLTCGLHIGPVLSDRCVVTKASSAMTLTDPIPVRMSGIGSWPRLRLGALIRLKQLSGYAPLASDLSSKPIS